MTFANKIDPLLAKKKIYNRFKWLKESKESKHSRWHYRLLFGASAPKTHNTPTLALLIFTTKYLWIVWQQCTGKNYTFSYFIFLLALLPGWQKYYRQNNDNNNKTRQFGIMFCCCQSKYEIQLEEHHQQQQQ